MKAKLILSVHTRYSYFYLNSVRKTLKPAFTFFSPYRYFSLTSRVDKDALNHLYTEDGDKYDIQQRWISWEKSGGYLGSDGNTATTPRKGDFWSFYRSQRNSLGLQEHLYLFLDSSSSLKSTNRLIETISLSKQNEWHDILKIKFIKIVISPMDFIELRSIPALQKDSNSEEKGKVEHLFLNVLLSLTAAFFSRTWLNHAESLEITEIHQIHMNHYSQVPPNEIFFFNENYKRRISESFWCLECCEALAEMIRKSYSVTSLSFRNLSWEPDYLAQSQSHWRIKPIIDAISCRAVTRMETLTDNHKTEEIPIQGFKSLCLIYMPSLLHSKYFLFQCLSNFAELKELILNHTPLLRFEKSNPFLNDITDNHNNGGKDCFFLLLDVLNTAIGGWHKLEHFSIADCGLFGNNVAKALWDSVSREQSIFPEKGFVSCEQQTNSVKSNLFHLNISHNKWVRKDQSMDETIFYISCCLRRIKTLVTFEARNCGFSGENTEHMKWIAESLSQSSQLKVIRISSNPLGDIGLKIFLQTMLSCLGRKKCFCLREIDLSRCRLTCRSLVPLTQMIWEWGAENPEMVRAKAISFLQRHFKEAAKINMDTFSVNGSSKFPMLQLLNLSMNDFRSQTLTDLCPYAIGAEGKTTKTNDFHINLFSFDTNFMTGNHEYRNRGEEKVLTSYELERADRENAYTRFKGDDKTEEKVLNSQHHFLHVLNTEPEVLWKEFGLSLTLGCRFLKALDLSDTGLEDRSLALLLSSPLILSRLECVHFECNKILQSPKCSDLFYLFLSYCAPMLRILDVRFTKFDDLTLSTLCDGLYVQHKDSLSEGLLPSQFKRLEELRISHTEVSDVGIQSMLEALEECTDTGCLKCILCANNRNISVNMKTRLKRKLKTLYVQV